MANIRAICVDEQTGRRRVYQDGDTMICGITGGGDMTKAVYDTDDDGKVNTAVAADVVPWSGVSGKPVTFPPEAHNHEGVYEPANANIQSHVASAHAPSDAQKNSDITKAEIEAKLTGEISSHTHAAGGGADPFIAKLVLANDIATGANVTPVDLTGMVFSFEANSKYIIDMYMITQAPAATTGSGFQINTSVAVTTIALSFFHQLANTGTLSGGSSIADDASVGVSSGRPSTNTNTPVYGGGVLITGANAGTAQFRYRSEVAAVSTCKANSIIRVMKV